IELQEFLIAGDDPIATGSALQRAVTRVRIRVSGHFARAVLIDDRHIVKGFTQCRNGEQHRTCEQQYKFAHVSSEKKIFTTGLLQTERQPRYGPEFFPRPSRGPVSVATKGKPQSQSPHLAWPSNK